MPAAPVAPVVRRVESLGRLCYGCLSTLTASGVCLNDACTAFDCCQECGDLGRHRRSNRDCILAPPQPSLPQTAWERDAAPQADEGYRCYYCMSSSVEQIRWVSLNTQRIGAAYNDSESFGCDDCESRMDSICRVNPSDPAAGCSNHEGWDTCADRWLANDVELPTELNTRYVNHVEQRNNPQDNPPEEDNDAE